VIRVAPVVGAKMIFPLAIFGAIFIAAELWIARGTRHQDLPAFCPEGYEKHVIVFLEKHLSPGDR
jgi:hypothetical protein